MEDISIASHSTDFADATVNKQDPEPNLSADELLLSSTLRKPASRDESLRYEDGSLIDDTLMVNPDCGYNSSASSTQQTNSDLIGRHLDNDDGALLNSRVSSRSSISSIPDSVLIHPPSELKPGIDCEADGHIHYYWDGYNNAGHGRINTEMPLRSIQTVRQREAAFRKPSSVRAMQMYTEDEDDDEFLTPPKRRGGHRMSDIFIRSAGSSPLKKSPYYSPAGSAGRQRVKKEYPLVLLHCNLLPPSLPVTGLVGYPDQKILRAVLPPEYWRRWKLLVEKVGSGVLRDRGVLITHPEDMYDLLEERLLESLELQRPRLDHGHFLGHEETDSEKEDYSATEDSATDDEQGEECPDCGKRLVRRDVRRKWEIKVFAANGLMRAGAWAAAWREMEKVDVEVGLWLPSEIRRELEKRLLDDDLPRSDLRLQVPQLNESTRDAISDLQNHSSRASTPTPLIDESLVPEKPSEPLSPVPAIATSAKAVPTRISTYSQKSVDDIDLQTLLINYIRVLASDRRNVTIAILSVLVAYLAAGIKTRTIPSDLRPFPQDMFEVPADSSTVSLAQHSTASWIKQPSSTVVAETSQESATAVKTSAFQQPSVGEVFSSMTLLTVTSVPSQTASNPEDSKPSLAEMELPPTQPNPVHDVIEQSDFSNSTTESREDQMKPTAAMGLVAETCEMVPTSQELIMSIE